VPRSAIRLVRRVADGDLTGARAAYERQILPVVDVLAATLNPTGTIKAGVRARGVEVGVPRRPGSDLSPHDRAALAGLCAEIAALERLGR
jgi:dihydrodipicolinate synthase/N-acetylneuraminate lyase